ncbi:MAG: hypothetical protein OXG79_12355 [Chloroflexi bacterium]|nr:hypothetical protein [Chloroflexota bacterium]
MRRDEPLSGQLAFLLQLVAVAFWWGAVLAPSLVSVAIPQWLPPEMLSPDIEGSWANGVSAVALLAVALLAASNAVLSLRRGLGWITVVGWAVLGATAVFLTFEELRSTFHASGVIDAGRFVFGEQWVAVFGANIWVLLLSPLIAAFLLVMVVFVCRGLHRGSRLLLALGFAAWFAVIALEALGPILARDRAEAIVIALEESLEFSGALFIALGGAIALGAGGGRDSRSAGVRWRRSLIGSASLVVVLGSLAVALVFRVPLVTAHTPLHYGDFGITLRNSEAVVQEMRMPASPIGRLDVQLTLREPSGRDGAVGVRFSRPDGQPRMLSSGSTAVPVDDHSAWYSIDLWPPVAEPEGVPLSMTVVADIGPAAELLVRATLGDNYPLGSLWVNGVPAWPDQDLEFIAYTAPEPTLSKLQALWWLVTSDWRWPALFAVLGVGLTLVTLTPAVLLVASAYAAGTPWGRRKHRRRPKPALRRA